MMNRRSLIGTGVASLAGIGMSGRAVAQDDAAVGMVAGGGSVETALGTVDFGLAARVDAEGAVTGLLTLRDFTQPGNPVVLQSTQLNRLEPMPEEGAGAWQLIGWASAGGQQALFVLRVDDADGPGSGKDTVALRVGESAAPLLEGEEQAACDCADYSYSLEGTVVAGDIIVT
jgi:hypothetical protein